MACRTVVRESKAKRLAGITNVHDLKISRCSLQRGKGDGFHRRSPIPEVMSAGSPPGTRRFSAYVQSERRRIVAQVRREVPKNRDFFAVRDSGSRCDDLLTTTVDNADWAGL
jgi:hypothetical protein